MVRITLTREQAVLVKTALQRHQDYLESQKAVTSGEVHDYAIKLKTKVSGAIKEIARSIKTWDDRPREADDET